MSQVMEKQDLLSAEDELRLVKMAQSDGNKKRYALDRLVRHNQGLVHRVVQRFPLKNAVVTYEDLLQQGMIGFLHAIELFDTDLITLPKQLPVWFLRQEEYWY